MKKIKLFIVLAFCFAINLQAQTECNFSPGRIGTGSETICYNGNPALITNSETNNAIALFNVNEALFGIHNDIIALPSDVWFTGNYTIESWVKPQKVQMYIFANGASYENRMIGNVFESFAGGQDFVSFAYGDENTYTPKLRVGGSNGTSSITSSIAIPENQWSHLAVTFNGTTATMYINGQVVATGPMAVPTSVLRTYNRIGNGRSIGQFDEVRIWNVYRTAEEIMATMNVPLLGSETGLKAYYDCNQGTAYVNNASITTLIDKSPNNKNATLSNFYMVEDQSNFVNGSPATINASGGSGTFTYKWQANGVDIANSNSATFDPPVGLTTTTTYTRFAEDETCNTFKQSLGSRVVTVRENFLSGEISSAGESICNNGDPAEIGSTTAASGGDGAITYKWQANGVDIANSNSATYDPPAGLTATTTYTRFAKEGTCNTSFTPSSGSYVVTMRGNFSSGEISSAGESICNNGDPAVIGSTTAASGGDGAFTYKWQANGVDIANSDSDSYDPPSGLTATTTYTRFAKEGTCNTSFLPSSGSYMVTVRGNFSAGEISSDGETICSNGDPAEIGSTTAASGGDGAITYKWQANGVDIANSNSATYDPPAGLTVTTTYTRFAKEGTCNTSFTPSPGSYVVAVRGNFSSGEISSTGESICNNGNPAVISSTTAASSSEGAITYKWQANGVDIENSNSDSYDPPAGLTTTTTYTRFAKDGTCYTSFLPSLGSYMVTVNPNLTSSVNIVADNADYPNAIAITANAVNGGTSPIYQWYNGTTAVGTNSATYTTTTLTLGQSLAIKVVMTSNATPCLTGSSATSNTINIAAPIVPSVRLVSAGIGVASTAMDPSAQLEVKSDTKGFLPPRMTATERDAIASPVAGLMLYCSNCGSNGELEVYNGATWTNLGGSAAAAIVGSATATSIVSDPTNFNIKTNTVVAVDQLDITPSADFSLNTGITRNTTATNSITNAAISRYYKFGVSINPFSGILKINYDETELNGLTESNLKLLYHNGTIWNSDVNSSNNAANNFVQSSSLSSVVLNEVTPGIACLNVGLADATATASSICADATTTLTYSGLTGTNASVTWTANADGTGTTYGTGTPSGAVGPGTYYAYATGDCGSAVYRAVTVATTPNEFYYADTDGDGFGNPAVTQQSCTGAPIGYVTNNTDCDDTDAGIYPNSTKTIPIGLLTGANVICNGTTVTYTIDPVANATSYQWTLPTGATGTSTSTSIAVTFSSTYTAGDLCVQALNGACLSATTCLTITPLTAVPPTPGAITGPVTVLAPSTTKTYTIASVAKATSYIWTAPANATLVSGQGTTSATFDFGAGFTTGLIAVKANNCKGNSATRSLTVKKVGLSAVRAAQCGATLTAINATIYANTITGATKYRFEVSNGSTVQTYETTNYYFNLTQLEIMPSFSTAYSIKVAILFDTVWQEYGAPCLVTTPSAPLTKVQDAQCGKVLTALNTAIVANTISGATNYRFRVVNGTSTQTIETVSRWFYLKSLTGGASFTTIYTISVATKYNGVWGDYGDACMVTTPGPTTKVQASQCGSTLATLSTAIVANSVTSATNYRFKVVNGTTTRYAEMANRWVRLTALTGGGLYSTAYTISVAVKYNGVWGAYGDECTVTTPSAPLTRPVDLETETDLTTFTVTGYPNPYTNTFQLDITTQSNAAVTVRVYDMIGKLIEVRNSGVAELGTMEIGDRYATGVYNVIVTQGTEVKTLRMIKK